MRFGSAKYLHAGTGSEAKARGLRTFSQTKTQTFGPKIATDGPFRIRAR
jgi:hypothetical protein